MTRLDPRKSVTRHAAETVVWHTRAADDTAAPDARELLEMLGLIEGDRVAPDDTNSYDDIHTILVLDARSAAPTTPPALPTHGTPLGAGVLHANGVLCDRCEAAMAPPPVEEPPPPAPAPPQQTSPDRQPRKQPAPRKAAPQQAKQPRTWKKSEEWGHGTPRGYWRHLQARKTDPSHETCQPCRDANTARHQSYTEGKPNRSDPAAAPTL